MAVVVAGWFEGMTVEQLTAAATEILRVGEGFALQWWGLAELPLHDRRLARAFEVGDRALSDAERENSGSPMDREEWVVGKAVAAYPMLFGDFLALRTSQAGRG